MPLSDVVNTFGQWLLAKHGERVHKIALDVGFTCPNRDGSKGTGGCTFCNNASFSPGSQKRKSLAEQMASGRDGIGRRTGAGKYLAYFQAYTNTYDEAERLRELYDQALAYPGMIGLAVGTRPDCVADEVLDLLAGYRARGMEVWLELGLQSAFDDSLARVNRGHGFAEYAETCTKARAMGIPICTHLIMGLPGETEWHYQRTLDRVLEVGTDGLKLHPLHIVRHTLLAHQWRHGEYAPMLMEDYIRVAADLIERTPESVVFHRVTGTASADILLAPMWCEHKWPVLNGIENLLKERGSRQGSRVGRACTELKHVA
ncbi:TIGR01212 family radical SAM protein [Parasulfuritortus cantonensis]|uniref:TIGR01212 family radical SAM protein n=1 Tax=Parasulfuritortus cantonensis TaxID=2528202 RepID=A0A4R1BR15_9PROT|nr:TIGR01212 family radical SAM protein [Parasulfuritortus cantonensis]TCJ16998.1 TIGR01212 family radical SAM protein [Parasulfuritortus cantonensis]TCJ20193.1 TIGR01212 family radical SAM protein [Parasulfuritortus cantonensis]